MHLDLTDGEAAALIKELADITGSYRYPVPELPAPRPPTKFHAASREQQRTGADARAQSAAHSRRPGALL